MSELGSTSTTRFGFRIDFYSFPFLLAHNGLGLYITVGRADSHDDSSGLGYTEIHMRHWGLMNIMGWVVDADTGTDLFLFSRSRMPLYTRDTTLGLIPSGHSGTSLPARSYLRQVVTR